MVRRGTSRKDGSPSRQHERNEGAQRLPRCLDSGKSGQRTAGGNDVGDKVTHPACAGELAIGPTENWKLETERRRASTTLSALRARSARLGARSARLGYA